MANLGLLERNSLYIATQALPSQETGKFHWSFFITDSNGGAEQHHWTKPFGEHNAQYQQRYIAGDIQALTKFSKYLTFTKIEAQWRPAYERLYETMSLIFVDGTQNQGNGDEKGLSHRWITSSVRKFVENGWLNIPNSALWDAVEQSIIERSGDAIVQCLQDLEKRTSFQPLPAVFRLS